MNRNDLILASASPRRKELLQRLGLPFRSIPSRIQEDFRTGESPGDHVLRLSEAKAREIAQRFPGNWIIGADTIVVVGEEILGKPGGPDEARRMLETLAGRTHEVLTGLCVLRLDEGRGAQRIARTRVHVRELSRDEMKWYIRTGEPFDKAGGYAIQGYGGIFISGIEGSYTNVVGLPTTELVLMLRDLGAWDLFAHS